MTESVGMQYFRERPRVAVLAAGAASGALGGAQRFYEGLLGGLLAIGCRAELIPVPADEPSFEMIESNYEHCRQMDLTEFDVVISTKAPTFAVDHPRHVMYLVHTIRVFDDMFHEAFPDAGVQQFSERARLHAMDLRAMGPIKAKFAIGHEVADRLYRWRGLHADVIHPPLGVEGFQCGSVGDYFFLPGRLHRWKRVDLVIKAVLRSSLPLRLVISGDGEAEDELKQLANGDARIEFPGRISDEQLVDLYSNALAVPFVPVKEDYGYVTLEAFASGKPVLTCHDSGEPVRFVHNGETGLVCEPTPEGLCRAMEWLFTHRDQAAQMGQNGADLVAGMESWPEVASRLMDAAFDESGPDEDPLHVTVLDMQPIEPPVGGGRLRLLGLYHNLGEGVDCRYVGSYDWPGESYRKHRLSSVLEEVDVPLSEAHHDAARALSEQAGISTVIDLAFSKQGVLSEEYLKTASESMRHADVVVFSHPWVFPLVENHLAPHQMFVYDSHNVEGFLRAQLLDEENKVQADLLRQVVEDEYRLCRRADLIFTCSHEDASRFNRIYETSYEKMRVVPNGVLAFSNPVPNLEDKAAAKSRLKLGSGRLAAIFIGSAYDPNVEAGRFIINDLAGLLPDVTFVVAGGVGSKLSSSRDNVIVTGPLDESEKYLWLCASDIAVNPMFSGSGTNIKMFDFMAMALPTVTTEVGARGIDTGRHHAMLIAEATPRSFFEAIEQLRSASLRKKIGDAARTCVEESYSWERISAIAGSLLVARARLVRQPQPFFSVIIPTYERHHQMDDLFQCLQKQIERDFEVVIIDQSADPRPVSSKDCGFPCVYLHSPVKGAVRARNTGAMLAQGRILAFIDDDCVPDEAWLFHARKYFNDTNVVGVEGLIESDHLGDPDWRPVTNVGFEGIGFMTANLFVRSDAFQQLAGFDLQFDCPHFREDTDLGWRLQELGQIPYAKDVKVFHPAQKRSVERESSKVRASFFQKDALLYSKHPTRYEQLFHQESQYKHTLGYCEHLLEGFRAAGVTVPDWIYDYIYQPHVTYE